MPCIYRSCWRRLIPIVLLSVGFLSAHTKVAIANEPFAESVQPLLKKYCFDCHADGERSGEIALDDWADVNSLVADQKTWERVRRVVSRREMPPSDQQQPSADERQSIVDWIDAAVLHIDCSAPDPGHVTIRRLNRSEYRHTIRDLLDVMFDADDAFPVDPSGYGFDNIGDVLNVPPVLMEKYLKAAEQIAAEAIVTTNDRLTRTKRYSLDLLEVGYNARQQGNGWVYLNSSEEDDVVAVHSVPVGGQFKLRVRAYSQQEGERPIELTFLRGDDVLETQLIGKDEPQIYESLAHATPGENRFRVAVRRIKDGLSAEESVRWKTGDTQKGAVYLEWLEVEGPFNVVEGDLPNSHRQLFAPAAGIEEPSKAVREILSHLLPRTYRRPVHAEDVERVAAIAESSWQRGADFESGIQDALTAVLVSPRFLYRAENVVVDSANAKTARLDDFAIAARLSYFLWGSMPDASLLELAQAGTLSSDDYLASQVRRMLADPKALSLTEDFAGQWLELRNLDSITPDAHRFPTFDEPLRTAMRRESELLFQSIVQEDRSIVDLLSADYTFVNERLAQHYGLEGIEGNEFQRVSLAGTPRRGILTHASILSLTSNPTRTSPVKRGKWVLENILGTPPPPPPPNVPKLDDKNHVDQSLPLRARLEQHRRDELCASCHRRMDSIGFAFEHFDAIGAFRSDDNGQSIDSAGELFASENFVDAKQLVGVLSDAERDRFVRCVAEKMLTYALGRGLEIYDECALEKIVHTMEENEYRFSALVLAIVQSVPFQYTR